MPKKIAILALTKGALELGARLAAALNDAASEAELVPCKGAIREKFRQAWRESSALVCIMATGIVVRQIAPLLEDKRRDPAVLVLDERGDFAISLLSGHLGGANALARRVAAITGGQAVLTTSSDVQGLTALDLWCRDAGLVPANKATLTRAMGKLADCGFVLLWNESGLPLPPLPPDIRPAENPAEADLFVTYHTDGASAPDIKAPSQRGLPAEPGGGAPSLRLTARPGGCGNPADPFRRSAPPPPGGRLEMRRFAANEKAPAEPRGGVPALLHPKCLCMGIGCNRGTPKEEILAALHETLTARNLARQSLRALASIDLKADEPGLLAAAEASGLPLLFFGKEALNQMRTAPSSAAVFQATGAFAVAEPAALLAAGQGASLLVPKMKWPNVTTAVAKMTWLPQQQG